MDRSQLELTPFVTTKTQRERSRWTDAPSYVRTRRAAARARSMWVKIGLCMALLAAVILFELLLFSREQPSVTVSSEDSALIEDEDALGRLRFVEAGGVTSVFKTSQRWSEPVAASDREKLKDDTLLKLWAEPGALVSVPASGEVAAISVDRSYGPYVRVSHGSELESFYYNLKDISVEEGQPLMAQDTLGRVGADGFLYMCIRRAGAPVDPADFIEAKGLS